MHQPTPAGPKESGARRVLGCAWSAISTLFVITLIAIFPVYRAYISLKLDAQGIPVQCAIKAKNETVSFRYDTWTRSNEVAVECPWTAENAPVEGRLTTVNDETYDRLHVGSQIQLNYLEHHPLESLGVKEYRLADQNTWIWLMDWWRTALLLPLAIGFVVLVALSSRGVRAARWLLVGAVGCVLLWCLIPQTVASPSGEQRSAEGTVTKVHHVTRILQGSKSEGFSVLQPYDVVAVKFVPEGWRDLVLGIDQVDSDSLPGLKEGDTVRVTYSVETPRNIAIQNATHTYYRKNIIGMVVGAFLMVLACLLYVVIISVLGKYIKLPWFIPFGKRKKR
jgi:hypothetical protein